MWSGVHQSQQIMCEHRLHTQLSFRLLLMPQWTIHSYLDGASFLVLMCSTADATPRTAWEGWGGERVGWRAKREAGREKEKPCFSHLCLSERGWSHQRLHTWNYVKKLHCMKKHLVSVGSWMESLRHCCLEHWSFSSSYSEYSGLPR